MSVIPYFEGKSKPNAIKLSSNESPFAPSPLIKQAALHALKTIHTYPNTDHTEIKTILAKYHNIEKSFIILGNGSDEILSFASQCFLHNKDMVVIPHNTFSIYTIISQCSNAKICKVPLKEGFLDLAAIRKTIAPSTAMVFICNPNNPTGTALPSTEIMNFASSLPKNTFLILDQAYIDFADHHYAVKPEELIKAHKNTIILHTFSKAHSLGGVRIGYGIAHSSIIARLSQVKMPFNINTLAYTMALTSLKNKDHYKKATQYIINERNRMNNKYKKLGISFYESKANFICLHPYSFLHENLQKYLVYIETKKRLPIADIVFDFFSHHNIMIRSLTSFGMPFHIRITIGTKKQNNDVISVFQKLITKTIRAL